MRRRPLAPRRALGRAFGSFRFASRLWRLRLLPGRFGVSRRWIGRRPPLAVALRRRRAPTGRVLRHETLLRQLLRRSRLEVVRERVGRDGARGSAAPLAARAAADAKVSRAAAPAGGGAAVIGARERLEWLVRERTVVRAPSSRSTRPRSGGWPQPAAHGPRRAQALVRAARTTGSRPASSRREAPLVVARLVRAPSPPTTGRRAPLAAAAGSAAALEAVGAAPLPPSPQTAPAPPPATAELDRLVDEVVRRLERRAVARRERLGRS